MLNNWLLWSIPLTVISGILLIAVILKLVKKITGAELFSVPLSNEMDLDFPDAGTYQMHLAGPRFSRAFAGLKYNLLHGATNQTVKISRSIPLQSSGISEVKHSHGRFTIESTGRHLLQVSGLNADKDCRKCRILFTHPYSLYALMCVVGIVLSGVGFIGGIVASILYLSGAR